MKIDFLSKRIIVTDSELKRSSNYGSKEYYEFLEITTQLPDFKIERQVVNHCHRQAPSPTYAFMEAYLSSNEDTFSALNDLLDLRRAGLNYFEVKKWFLSTFPTAITSH